MVSVRKQTTRIDDAGNDADFKTQILHISVEPALKSQCSHTVADAVRKELQNIVDNNVWVITDFDFIGSKNHADIISSHIP